MHQAADSRDIQPQEPHVDGDAEHATETVSGVPVFEGKIFATVFL